MSEFKFFNDNGESFILKCIVAPTDMETDIGGGVDSCHYFAVAEDDNVSIMSDNHILDAIHEYKEVDYQGVTYIVNDCMFPSNTTYQDHINKNIKCMILLSLTEIE